MQKILKKDTLIEGELVRKGTYVRIEEGFAPEYLGTAVTKITSILSKRLGIEILLNPFPREEAREGGLAFLCTLDDKHFISLNFKSNALDSIGLYDSPADVIPNQTIMLNNYGIAKVIGDITELLAEFLKTGSIALEEKDGRGRKGTASQIFNLWLADNLGKNVKLIQDERLSKIYKEYVMPWLDDNQLYSNLTSFTKDAKTYLAKNKLENRFTRKVTVISKGGKLKEIPVQDTKEKEFDLMKSVSYESIFDQLNASVTGCAMGAFNSIYIYGPQSGTGKTFEVKKTLDNLNANYVSFTGSFKSVYDLVVALYKYKDDTILVFDDLKLSKDGREILLAVLQDQNEREVVYLDTSKVGKRDAPPPRFTFTSSVIFISNSTKIDSAIADRSVVVPVVISKDEVLRKINNELKSFMPKIPMPIKTEVMEWFVDTVSELSKVSFRAFKQAVGYRLMSKDNSEIWKIWTKRSLNV